MYLWSKEKKDKKIIYGTLSVGTITYNGNKVV